MNITCERSVLPRTTANIFIPIRYLILAALYGLLCLGARSAEIPTGEEGFKTTVKPFFKKHCVECHGADKSKGKVTLHTIGGDLSSGKGLEHWETILDVLKYEEMPPEEEPQPDDAQRQAVAKWIESGLRDYVSKGSKDKANKEKLAPIARRLTNFEYENTMRDLLGIDLKLIDGLPEDPIVPYKFNNTASYMLMGPEQVSRYKKTARRAMASVIVDPKKPEIHKTQQKWQPSGAERGAGRDELNIWNNSRGTPGRGMSLKGFPETGEFKIRFQTSAILPPGINQVPLRFVMGYNLGVNSSTLEVAPIGTVNLSNNPDDPQIYEMRGRIENFPRETVMPKKGIPQPMTLTITPQNLYDDGTLNDENRYFYWPRQMEMPRIVINWLEFEGPITEVWPPLHHTQILFESPNRLGNPEAYVREVLQRFMSRAYRRPAMADEVARFEKIYALIRSEIGTLEAAMRETLAMVLISPQFLYHTVADDGAVQPQYELASRLSYFLWGSMPDKELMKLAADGKLEDNAVIEKQVIRLLADKRSGDFVHNFAEQWMDLHKLKTIPVNAEIFPRFLYYVSAGERKGTEVPYVPTIRDHMIEETVGFVAELIRRNASVTNLVHSDFAYLNQPLAAHYGVDGVEGLDFRPVAIKPQHHLGGLLTQGSVLVANSTGTAPHPIYRAVWLREAILGDEVKPPPAEIPALSDSAGESAEKALSIKDLLAKHRNKASCADCHVRLDPWGIPFERYNSIGQFQPMVPKDGVRISGFNKDAHKNLAGYQEYLTSINTVEVEAEARVPHGPEVTGMEDLKEFLMDKRMGDVADNVLRRLLTYGIGRELSFRDRFEIEKILKKSEKDQYLLKSMIIEVCQSTIFKNIQSKQK
ncbi:MAG: hypothetical protein ACJAR1_001356 [Rubritalea sp.]|jgi:hypothetical protein